MEYASDVVAVKVKNMDSTVISVTDGQPAVRGLGDGDRYRHT
jgi:hypothetical protein